MIPVWPLWGVSEGFVGELVGVMQKVKQQEVEGPCVLNLIKRQKRTLTVNKASSRT